MRDYRTCNVDVTGVGTPVAIPVVTAKRTINIEYICILISRLNMYLDWRKMMMKAMTGFTRQNWSVACLQNRRNPMVYVFPARQQVPYKHDDLMGFPRISDMMFPSPPRYS